MSMEESVVQLVAIVVGVIVIVVGHLIYNRSPRLHTCSSCGRYLAYKSERYWYKVDGKNVPVCSSCEGKGLLADGLNEISMSDDEKAKYIIIGKLSVSLTPEELEQVEVSIQIGKVTTHTQNKAIAEKISSILNAEMKETIL